MSTHDWHIHSTPPIDSFNGMTQLSSYLFPDWNSEPLDNPHAVQRAIKKYRKRLKWAEEMNTQNGLASPETDYNNQLAEEGLDWAEAALDALKRGSRDAGWEGDFRHEPYVGALPCPENLGTGLYLLVKQNNNGMCFIISQGFSVPLLKEENGSACYRQVTVPQA